MLAPPFMTFARCFVASIVLSIVFGISNPSKLRFPYKNRQVIISGVLLTVHWVTFFYSITYSNVAIAAVSVFTFPIMTALLEPFISKTPFDRIHILLGIIILIGIYIMSPDISLANDTFLGILFGLLSALAYAIRNIVSRNLTSLFSSTSLMFYQVVLVTILLFPYANTYDMITVRENILPLLALGILPTIIGHAMLVESFKFFSAAKVSILSSFQPLFSIGMAVIFLNEYPTSKALMGGLIIFFAVFFEVLRKRQRSSTT